jgi:peroxiredoxin
VEKHRERLAMREAAYRAFERGGGKTASVAPGPGPDGDAGPSLDAAGTPLVQRKEQVMKTDHATLAGAPLAESRLLPPGAPAPAFTLRATPDQRLSLGDFRGRPLILAFYPADWSPVCGDQLTLYQEILPEFRRLGAELVGISVDGIWCHLAFARDRKLHFPLLSDFEPKGAISWRYGAYRSGAGECARALFLIDPQGTIRWSYLSPVGVNPGADGILTALEALHAEEPRQ